MRMQKHLNLGHAVRRGPMECPLHRLWTCLDCKEVGIEYNGSWAYDLPEMTKEEEF